ncbi:MAG: hypothetical protein JNK02_15030 [Planctomycetes bacterium]|nr:hypothetical protein [Planctomycetota bacterium]
MVISARLIAALALLSGTAAAQNLNINLGTTQVSQRPSSTFGAGANQPGFWNLVSANDAATANLVDVNGVITNVAVALSGGFGNFGIANANWNGDDEKLLEWAADVGGIGQGVGAGTITWTFSGLVAGTYEVYSYAIAPDLPQTYRTRVQVTNANEGPQIVGGAWNGQPYALNVTHARHTVTLTAGQTLTVITSDPGTPAGNLATANGFQIKTVTGGGGGPGTPAVAYCFGDGTATPCPCGNTSGFGANEGCLNSLGLGGKLVGQGNALLSNDTFTLVGTRMPNSSALYFQGTAQQSGGMGAVFGDGLRCAAGTITRLGTKTNAGGASAYPTAGDQSVSVRGGVFAAGTREYQVWYRNSADFCTPSGFNLTNAVQATWAP